MYARSAKVNSVGQVGDWSSWYTVGDGPWRTSAGHIYELAIEEPFTPGYYRLRGARDNPPCRYFEGPVTDRYDFDRSWERVTVTPA